MAYKYYTVTESDEHYPYADELADYLYWEHDIQSPSGGHPIGIVRAMLAWLHKGEPKMYYNTRNGLKRVYPYGKRVLALLVQNCVLGGGVIEIDGKRYGYKKVGHVNRYAG